MEKVSEQLHYLSQLCHVSVLSTLLGASLYQTFIVTKVSFQSLARQPFSALQERLFSSYFRGQCSMILLLGLTYPAYKPASVYTRAFDLTFLSCASISSLLNLNVYGPQTSKAMISLNKMGL